MLLHLSVWPSGLHASEGKGLRLVTSHSQHRAPVNTQWTRYTYQLTPVNAADLANLTAPHTGQNRCCLESQAQKQERASLGTTVIEGSGSQRGAS